MAGLGRLFSAGSDLADEILMRGVGIPTRENQVLRTGEFDPRYDPRVLEKDRVENLTRKVSIADNPEVDKVKLSQFEGMPYVTSMSDRTMAGGILTGINNVDIPPVPLQGGQGYMFRNPGQVWASAPAITRRMHNGAIAGGGDSAAFFPFRMGPTGGDYAEKTGRSMIGYNVSAMNKRQKRDLNRAIKKEFKDWPGIDSEKATDYLSTLNGPRRSRFLKVMDSRRNDGGLSLGEARVSVVDPEQLNASDFRLMNVGEIDATSPLIENSGHITYSTGLPGRGIGRLVDGEKISPFDLAPRGNNGPITAVDPLNPTDKEMYALRQQPEARGVITSDILKNLQSRGVEVGNADPRLLAGLAGGTGLGLLAASDDSDAGVISRGGKRLIEAWHGSPHRFDKFSMDNIGTGEGAQAYGHGLYFADEQDVAKSYRDNLSQAQLGTTFGDYQIPESVYDDVKGAMTAADRAGDSLAAGAIDELLTGDFTPDKIRKDLIDNAGTEGLDPTDALRRYDEAVKLSEGKPGALYRVELDVDPDTLLDYDIPLSEQNEYVRSRIESVIPHVKDNPDLDIRDIHNNWDDKTDAEISGLLRESGIPGLQYYDGNSQNLAPELPDYESWLGYNKGGEVDSPALRKEYAGYAKQHTDSYNAGRTRNYVMFDDKPISIVERGSADPRLLGATALAAGGALSAPLITKEKQHGDIRAPKHGWLASAVEGMQGLERRLEGSPAALLYPEGLVNYMGRLSYGDKPTWKERIYAGMDVLP